MGLQLGSVILCVGFPVLAYSIVTSFPCLPSRKYLLGCVMYVSSVLDSNCLKHALCETECDFVSSMDTDTLYVSKYSTGGSADK